MVEYGSNLNSIFSSLSDSTRRNILEQVAKTPLSISEIAENYKMSFAAVAKHVNVLQKAKLVTKQRKGKQQIIEAVPSAMQAAATYFEMYQAMWEERFSLLKEHLKESKNN